ncbi:MAG TPA: peptidoglycan-binding protein, partial [Polyangia bacterium]|nr:peptidoglycan-binding protein [Polyangia bacterium]
MPPVTMVTLSADGYADFSVPYNPNELTFDKQMQYAEITIPGLDAPLQQFVRGNAERLTIELFFDSTEKGMGLGAQSVTALTDKVFQLARIDPDLHAPPIVTFSWNHHFPGDSLDSFLGPQR